MRPKHNMWGPVGFFSRIFGGGTENRSRFSDALAAFVTGEDSPPSTSSAGVAVTESTALALTTVYACVRILAQTTAMLPLVTYARMGDEGRRRAPEHPVYELLLSTPNSQQTSYDWRRLMSVHQNLWGAGISEIEFRNGQPVALWPIPPWRVTPDKTDAGDIFYRVQMPDGSPERRIFAYQTVVFTAMTTSSYEWMSPIRVARDTIGYATALNEFGSRTFSQGINPAGTISLEGHLKEESEQSLRKQFNKNYAGLGNSHRLMLLEDGMKFERIGLPPEDAQYIESRSWTVSELARIWNVPLHLLQDHSKATTWGSGLEELNLGFLTFTMQPLFAQWEQELHRRLFVGETEEYFPEFLTIGLLKGRVKDRYDAYVQGLQNGFLSPNDVRKAENLNPIPAGQGGDDYLVQLNMQKLGDVGNEVDAGANSEEDPAAEE